VHFHELAIEYDRERTLFMKHVGIKILRFENRVVFKARETMLQRIRDEFDWWRVLPE
jgi:very-short-patch-repair endonuclease